MIEMTGRIWIDIHINSLNNPHDISKIILGILQWTQWVIKAKPMENNNTVPNKD